MKPAFSLLLAAVWASGCLDADAPERAEGLLAIAESEAIERDDARVEPATPPQTARGYADLRESTAQKSGKARSLGAVVESRADSDALSELAYRTEQSLNQRANEAFDYLGSRALPVGGPVPMLDRVHSKRAPLDKSEIAPMSVSRQFAQDLQGGPLRRGRAAPESKETIPSDPTPRARLLSPAQRFERERRSLENLFFQPASGYWANTYVPGDPVMRWLESRLGSRDRKVLQAFSARPLLLDAAAHPTPQPFDPPSYAAVSIFLQADRRGLEHPGRMLLQVGLLGAHRRGGLRPAMNVGIVLDLRGPISAEIAGSMRALVDGFLKAKDVGDRFSLILAGQPGGRVVEAPDFRHGPISVAMGRLIEPLGPGAPTEPILGLEEAVADTAAALQRSDDPTAPLGSSLVLLVTGQPFGPFTDALARTAHASAVAGVPMSVVGIGDGVRLAEIERVTLAGQGSRRLMHSAAEAESLVERELSALARVIARALRLRIRLAPGVQLIDVVGAERLDATGAQQVRQAERSIDRRLSRNLGIESDRGEDEEGIQIVIPTFHSGDAHAVLLDVVASGPGPIADVTLRFKDLVYLRNGVARDNFSLARNSDPPGPLERNVVKNYLAIRLSDTLKNAGRMLLRGEDDQTIAMVREFYGLLESLQREVPGFQNDVDLATDADMLGEFLALLDTSALQGTEPRQVLADSLQLSGYFKTVPRSDSEPWDSRR